MNIVGNDLHTMEGNKALFHWVLNQSQPSSTRAGPLNVTPLRSGVLAAASAALLLTL